LIRSEGLVGLVSLSCLGKHLENCNMWCLATQASPNHAIHACEDLTTFGTIVNKLLDSSSAILRCVVCFVINGAGAGAASSVSKEEVTGTMEAMFRAKLVHCLVESTGTYGSSLSNKCVANIVCVLSELVLSTPAFLKQVKLALVRIGVVYLSTSMHSSPMRVV
jgi:hypothetical protein